MSIYRDCHGWRERVVNLWAGSLSVGWGIKGGGNLNPATRAASESEWSAPLCRWFSLELLLESTSLRSREIFIFFMKFIKCSDINFFCAKEKNIRVNKIIYKVFRRTKSNLVLCSNITIRLAQKDHVICLSQSYGLFTTKYKFWFTMSKHLICVHMSF